MATFVRVGISVVEFTIRTQKILTMLQRRRMAFLDLLKFFIAQLMTRIDFEALNHIGFGGVLFEVQRDHFRIVRLAFLCFRKNLNFKQLAGTDFFPAFMEGI